MVILMKQILFFAFVTLITVNVSAQYKVGDFYSVDGVEGVVFRVDNNGEHGLVVSLDRFNGKWTVDKKTYYETNAFFEDDGQKNMEEIAKYVEETGRNWSTFPFFEWCRNKGEGWYAPALDELRDLVTALNGSMGTYNSSNYIKFDQVILDHGGESVFSTIDYPLAGKMPFTLLSSTEGSKGKVFASGVFATSPFADPKVIVGEIKKSIPATGVGARAVHKF